MVKKNNAKNFHSKILAVNQGELTVLIRKTSEYAIHMNSPFLLSLSSCSVWYFAYTVHHRQLDRGPTSMVPPGQGLRCSTCCFSTAASFSNIGSTRGEQSAVLSAFYICKRKLLLWRFHITVSTLWICLARPWEVVITHSDKNLYTASLECWEKNLIPPEGNVRKEGTVDNLHRYCFL